MADRDFADRLRAARRAAGFSQAELAERAGLSERAVSDLERGARRNPHPATRRALADALALAGADRAGLVGDAPAPRPDAPAAAPRSGLPASPGSFVGREGELARLAGLLADPATRLLTLVGPGGVGKTRLALEAARAAAPAFPDGAAFVDLAPLRDPGRVLPEIARAAGGPVPAALADRRTLLLLDNLEHLTDCGPALADLLAAAPGLVLLATSRVPLRLRWERLLPLDPLPVPPPGDPDPAAYAAVRLFADRAAAADPAFDLAPAAADVAAVCRRLDGLPLAIELVAGTARRSPAALLASLDRHPLAAPDAPRDLPERQRSLRATIAWSHDLLPPADQARFRRLAVFRNPWTAEAALAVAGEPGDDAETLLDRLVEANLVRRARGASGPDRHTMLETVREYAAERLRDSDEESAAANRHAAWFRDLVARADLSLWQRDSFAAAGLRSHTEDVDAAIAWLDAAGREAEALRTALGLRFLWREEGRAPSGIARLSRAAAHPGLSPEEQGVALYLLSNLLNDVDRLDEAHAALVAARDRYRTAGLPAPYVDHDLCFLEIMRSPADGIACFRDLLERDAFKGFDELLSSAWLNIAEAEQMAAPADPDLAWFAKIRAIYTRAFALADSADNHLVTINLDFNVASLLALRRVRLPDAEGADAAAREAWDLLGGRLGRPGEEAPPHSLVIAVLAAAVLCLPDDPAEAAWFLGAAEGIAARNGFAIRTVEAQRVALLRDRLPGLLGATGTERQVAAGRTASTRQVVGRILDRAESALRPDDPTGGNVVPLRNRSPRGGAAAAPPTTPARPPRVAPGEGTG